MKKEDRQKEINNLKREIDFLEKTLARVPDALKEERQKGRMEVIQFLRELQILTKDKWNNKLQEWGMKNKEEISGAQ